ncbi:hypothetical protein DCAR_0309988 [Daucus carota subsp. sativus]|uniref:Cytochrome P450 n=1 Tax=Daucus carota subsp. sativus TaxID=79200 RepID=A0AAF0WKF7_DAUCS|nr:hypothetical protein DCAR_0309988 [Daucus carota subsp. sativus]
MVAAYWCFIFFIFFLYLLVKNQQKKNKNNPPSPRSLPLLGHLHLIKEPLHQTLETLSSKYGDILLLRFGLKKVLVICSPSAIEECFTRNDTVFANRPVSMATIHLSYDFTTMTVAPYGDLWRNLRRLAALEIFSPNRIAFFTDIRDNEIMLLINQLVKKCQGGGEKVELKTTFNELAFNILSMTIGGRRYYGENVEDAEEARNVRYVMREMLDISVNSNVGDLFPVLRWFDYGGVEKKMKDIMRRLDVFLQDLIDKRRGDRLVDDSDDDEDRTEHRKNWKKKNMVDHLLLLQDSEPENYPDKIIKGIILVLLIAGTDTLSLTLEWAMALLLNHPESIEKVRSEIETHVPKDRLLEEQDLPKLSYLQNVITETLRLHPPLPFLIPHECSADCTVGGYNVTRGTMLLVNLRAIHRDPKVWTKPNEFIPEMHKMRSCPGAGLGKRVLGLALGRLIQVFEWERVGIELEDMTEGPGFSTPKIKPLEAICKPRVATIQYSGF